MSEEIPRKHSICWDCPLSSSRTCHKIAPLWHASGMKRGRILSFFLLLNIAVKYHIRELKVSNVTTVVGVWKEITSKKGSFGEE